MILKEITPLNWGPFDGGTSLIIEGDVTVLTAPNDAGKSSLLRLLTASFAPTKERDVREDDLNVDYREGSRYPDWKNDHELGCRLRFTATEGWGNYLAVSTSSRVVEAGDEFRVNLSLAPNIQGATVEVFRGGKRIIAPESTKLKQMPQIISLPTHETIGNVIDLLKPNSVERLLLEVAFGRNFDAQKLVAYGRVHYHNAIRQAQARLDLAVAKVVPPSLRLSLFLQTTEHRNEIAILPYDQEFGSAPLTSRGTGIRLLLSLLVALLEARNIDGQMLICIDEPETALHADAQHLLRGLLEDLAKESRIQVVYATHSSAMINNMRPRSVRLLRRVLEDERVTTLIDNRPIDNNFIQIRTSLGISPSDSLQFAPVSVVVEGPSEAIGMQLMLDKLYELDTPGFEDVPLITPQCHIIDGVGDNYTRQAKFALSQNSQVVVFLDGDKKVAATTFEALPSVAFVQLENGEEIEQLISREVYFRAISQGLEDQEITSVANIEPIAFDEWLIKQPERMHYKAFSKKIESWLDETVPEFRFVKPKVLRQAIDLVDSSEHIRTKELLVLISEIMRRLPAKE